MMNSIWIIILGALVVEYLLNLIADLLNLKALKLELPPVLEVIYQPSEYRNSQEYTRATTRFGFVTATFQLLILLGFWFTGGFNFLDQFIRMWEFPPVLNGLLYIGTLLLVYSLLTIPFSIYATFVIEEHFGFNRTTPQTFFLDQIKGLVLALLIGGPLLAGILALFQYAGNYAWVYAWISIAIFSLVIQFVAPVWIMPLFNKFTMMAPGELKDSILQYVASVNYPVSNLFVIDGSRRSVKSNAFFTGFGRNKRIALFDTLIEQHTVPELLAVLAHEIGHHKKKHILQSVLISIVHTGILLFLLSVFLGTPDLYQAFYMEQSSIYTGLLFFGLLYTPVELLLSLVTMSISRRHEYQADRFAVETIEDSESMAAALKKLSASNLSNLTPHPFYVFLNYSHPPLLQRVTALSRYRS